MCHTHISHTQTEHLYECKQSCTYMSGGKVLKGTGFLWLSIIEGTWISKSKTLDYVFHISHDNTEGSFYMKYKPTFSSSAKKSRRGNMGSKASEERIVQHWKKYLLILLLQAHTIHFTRRTQSPRCNPHGKFQCKALCQFATLVVLKLVQNNTVLLQMLALCHLWHSS